MSKIDELIKKLCPYGVEYKKLEDISTFERGKGFKKEDKGTGDSPIIFYGELYTTYGNYIDEIVSFVDEKKVANKIYANKEDIVLPISSTTAEAQIGKASVVRVDRAILGSDAIVIHNNINSSYLMYYINSKIFEFYKMKCVSGTTIRHLAPKEMMQIKVAVPPLEVQCEIVHILDDFTLLSAELSAELKARKNQYNYYLEKLLCNDKNAKTYKLKELCVFFNGDRGKNYPKVSEMVNKGVPFVNAGDVNRVIDYKNCNKITLEKYNSMNGAKLRKNDILYCLRGSTGKNGIYELDEGTVASSLVAIRVNSIINYKYLYYLLNSSLERRQRYKSDTGAAQPNLSVQSISNYEFPVPNMEEQNKIVNILDKFEKLCNDISEGLPAEIEARQKQYEYYRDKLLTFKELKVNE